jgi:hypothetical protein
MKTETVLCSNCRNKFHGLSPLCPGCPGCPGCPAKPNTETPEQATAVLNPTTEAWYEIEYSRTDEDDWYKDSDFSGDTERAIKKHLAFRRRQAIAGLSFRPVRKTLTTEVLP